MPVLRKDPVVERWVLFSEARGKRPSDFGGHKIAGGGRAVEDPATCPFEGGREGETPPEVLAYRAAGGAADSPGWSVRVVPNKFPALTTEGEATHTVDGPFQSINGVGAHEVIVETPDHAPTTADLEPVQCAAVLQAFQDRIHAHTKDPRVAYVSIFKNEGRHAGASRAHTHTQLIAMPIVPKTMQEKLAGCRAWHAEHQTCVFCAMLEKDLHCGSRVIAQDAHFAVVAPYAPRIPFETWIVPKRHEARFESMQGDERNALATMLPQTLRRLNTLLKDAPYNFAIHTAPCRGDDVSPFHWHLEILPFTLYIGGFERGTDCYINAMWPETAAQLLRDVEV